MIGEPRRRSKDVKRLRRLRRQFALWLWQRSVGCAQWRRGI